MGDFNAKVGGSREGIEQAVGPHTTGGELNENGQRLVDLCLNNNLILAKTFFRHKDIYKKLLWQSQTKLIWIILCEFLTLSNFT